MNHALQGKAAAKLEEAGPSSALAFEVDVEKYFDFISEVLESFVSAKKMKCVYVTSSIPSSTLIKALEVLGIDLSNVHFVDCVSKAIFGSAPSSDNISYVESPTMLENIVLKVKYFLRKGGGNLLVVVDSANAFAVYNDMRILFEFFQILLNAVRSRGDYAAVISISSQTKPEVKEMLALVSDQVISLS
ncbi:MAG: hypothetical protein QHH00_04905 [Methanomassiliicoccales archaeon]|jgi:KaiC/GvpD/RAD55 family RecA-like ATPase|nr:hypothetical protein [Methanomassiliicoccales archaeon]